jgi:Fe-S-cluster-containing dehydrogenase component/formate-dependent nitrite reductase membrane component NrfD
MNYGFVIDNRSCIGCHACSTACKAENEVPLGVYRTWVKNVDVGEYPNVTRHFQVTRCNHCANPPCVRICPTQAMYQRGDGIVEFDSSVCIGCKACMQACPYDAIYMDPESNTAAKCHYCAHRTELGLEPACVVVCPTHSIIAGDMDDPNSEISRALAKNHVTVRKPEQGTAPKLLYISGNDVALHPTAVERTPVTFMAAETIPLHSATHGGNGNGNGARSKTALSGTAIRPPAAQGRPQNGPIQIGGNVAGHMVQVTYNAQHEIPWHWPVPAYLVTKGIGAGIFMLLSLGLGLGLFAFDSLAFVVGGFLSLLFILITTAFLVHDLTQPRRFFYIVIRPQWKSWLARGAFLLMGFSVVGGLWWLLEAGALLGLLPDSLAATVRPIAMWVGLPLAAGVTIYTAFLFGQAEGRDLWQSTLLPVHLLIQALMVGGGMILLMDLLLSLPYDLVQVASITFVGSAIIDLLVTLLGEFGMPHASEVAAQAAHEISSGRYKNHFWWGSIVLGHAVPLSLMLLVGVPVAAALAAVSAIVGLYLFEYAFVMAPQEIPNS